jgi:hypothetical protein
VRKPGGKRPLGRSRYRWVDSINMNLGEVGWSGVGWIGRFRIGTSGEGSYESSIETLGSV